MNSLREIHTLNLIKVITICIFIWNLLCNSTPVDAVTYTIPLVYSDGNSSLHGANKVKWSSIDHMQESLMSGNPGQGYYITINIGTPSQQINVLVDTGSSNFAIAASPNSYIDKYFNTNKSNSYKRFESNVYAPYTQGSWEGVLGSDIVALPNAADLSITAYVATIFKSDNFFINGSNWQGILGLAYPTIARPNSSIVPFFDQLVNEKHVSNVFSLQFCGQNNGANSTGGMVLGGVDPKLYSGEITYAPLHREWYYEVVLTDVTIGDISIPVDCKELNKDKAIVDSGTTSFRLPRMAFEKAIEIFKRQVHLEDPIPDEFWSGDTIMCWLRDNSPLKLFPRLRISIAHSRNSSFTLLIPPQQYLRFVGDIMTPLWNRECYRFAINPSDSGAVLGTVTLEGFYLVFDRQNKRVGFSKATCDYNSKFEIHPQIIGPFGVVDPIRCAYNSGKTTDQTLAIVAYLMAAFCGLCLIPFIILLSRRFGSYVVTSKKEEQQTFRQQGDMASLMEND